MGSDLYVAMTGAIAALRELDLVANNLANADTVGFRADRSAFAASLEAAVRDQDGTRVSGGAGHVFVAPAGSAPVLAPGPVMETGGALDVAIQGEGFFAVTTPGGPRYTRAGSFVVDAARRLVTPQGDPVQGDSGPIQVGDRPVAIGASGDVVDDQGEVLGRLRVTVFDDPSALRKDGRNLLRAEEGAGPRPREDARLVERSVERSNVAPVQELAALVVLQRAFDVALRLIQSDDEATQALIREVSS